MFEALRLVYGFYESTGVMPAKASKILPSLTVADATAWRQWLSKEGSSSPGVWLLLGRKGTVEPTSLSLDQAVEEALCYGWINGQGQSVDASTYSARMTPRRAKSMWSKRNVDIVARMETEGRMQEAGRTAVEAAKADGRWGKAYAGGVATASMPEDLLTAIASDEHAQGNWNSLSKQSRYMMYITLNNLKTQAGREKRIKTYVEMLRRGEIPHARVSITTRPKPPTSTTLKASESTSSKVRKRKTGLTSPHQRTTRTRSGRQSQPPTL